MEIRELERHLWWWTAPHPEWGPGDFADGRGWEREVSSYALVEDDSLVLFDPLVPAGDEAAFWAALDGDVEHHGSPAILLTVYWHARSAAAILERYEGSSLWAHEPSVDEVGRRVPVSSTFADGDRLPGGVEAVAMHHVREAAFHLPGHRAVVFGDSVLGYEDRVEPPPESWLREGESRSELRASIARALDAASPRWLLLTHGGPREDVRALRQALESP